MVDRCSSIGSTASEAIARKLGLIRASPTTDGCAEGAKLMI